MSQKQQTPSLRKGALFTRSYAMLQLHLSGNEDRNTLKKKQEVNNSPLID
jgi:hypothetical protein